MWQNPHDAYLEGRISSADPVELIGLLYQACTNAVRDARRHLAEGDIAARSRAITKAYDVLMELTGALDHKKGGEISVRLAALYVYMQGRLLEANCRQEDGPLAEVLGLLCTLGEAWDGVKAQTRPPERPANAWTQSVPQEPSASTVHAWSF